MGAANCCKKPEEIVVDEIKNGYGDKINPLDQESYPQDTEYVFNANVYPQDDKAQQESNQKLYEQEGSPQIGGAYEVAINESSPEKEVQTPQIQIQEQQEQNEPQNINSNQYSPEKLAMYQDQININAKPENPPKEEIKNEKPEIIDNNQVNQAQAQMELKQSNEQNIYEIKQSGVSTQGPVDLTTLASRKSAAPINTNSQVINAQKVVQTPLNNSPYLINQQVPQVNSQIQVKEAEADEDLNKYFQIPTNLQKAKPNVPNNEVKKNEEVNVASVKPIEGNDDINKYFNQIIPEQNTNTNNMTDQEILNKYFSQPNQNVQNVPNNFKQVTTTTTTKTTGNINLNNIPPTQINNLVNMNNIPATFGSNDINNFKQTTTTTTTKTTGNIPPSQINKIVDINNIPATFGSNDLKNFKQTTTTTTTQTTGNIPPTFGSSNINNINPNQKTTVTTTTSTTPIDLKQFGLDPNQFSSEPIDLKQFGLEPNSSQISVGGQKNVAQPVEDYSKYFQNIQPSSSSNSNPIDLKQFGLEKNASNISNVLQGSNITFKQPGQSIISSNNYGTSSSIAAPNPVITNNNYTNYYKTTKTTTTSIPYPTQVNYGYNYGVNIPQGKTTTTTVTNTSGIPIKSAVSTQNYQNFASTANYTTTNKVVKSYAGPTKVTSYNYNYSYNIPGTTTTTTTTSIRK